MLSVRRFASFRMTKNKMIPHSLLIIHYVVIPPPLNF